MSKIPEKETPTAPPSSAVAYPTVASVITAPPVAGYPLQQIPMQGVPMVQNQPYPTAYPQNYQQQYHPTQSGQIAISPTSQTTPLMVDANGIALQEVQHSLQQQQRQTHQQQRRIRVSSLSSISTTASEDCGDVCCCCFEVFNDCCCCCCSSGFNCLCKIIGKMFSVITVLFVIALIWHFLNQAGGN